jgi:hypothetical protein
MSCERCHSARKNILWTLVLGIIINAVIRTYFSLPIETVADIIVIPIIITLATSIFAWFYISKN